MPWHRAVGLPTLVLMVLVATITMIGCGTAAQGQTPTTGPVATVELPDGTEVPVLPAPPIPKFPGSQLTNQNGDDSMLDTYYSTRANSNVVYDFYRRELPKNGWATAALSYGNGLTYEVLPRKDQGNGYWVWIMTELKGDKTSIRIRRMMITWDDLATPVSEPSVPVYPGASLVESRQGPENGTIVTRATYTTRDSPEAVMAFYRQAVPAYGWRPASGKPSSPVPDHLGYVCGFQKIDKGGYYLNIDLSNDGAQTTIQVTKTYMAKI